MLITESNFLDQQRMLADEEADRLVYAFFEQGEQMQIYQAFSLPLRELKEATLPSDLKTFLTAQREEPQWLDWELLRKGQAFFYEQAQPIMTLLGALSLPYCYAASPGNKALFLSEKMRKTTHKRLLDTADFIIEVCRPGAFEEEGVGYLFVRKIRFIHAISRYYIKQRTQWNTKKWGEPINMEDAAGTNLAFSYLILQGLKKGGYPVQPEEMESFLHLWKYIGYLMGLDERLLPNDMYEAFQLEYAIRKRHFKPSKEGKTLTRELLDYYKTIVLGPKEAYLMDAQVRYLLGKEVADCLGIPSHPMRDTLVRAINFTREAAMPFVHKTPTFEQMLANQQMLKAKMVG